MRINPDIFKLETIPEHHPKSMAYLHFWRDEKRKCIEGTWSNGIFMPGRLYFYINYSTIELASGKTKTLGRPSLRDIEWEVFRFWEECRGFSGFENSPYSAHRALKNEDIDDETIINLYCRQQGKIIPKLRNNLFNPNGSRKIYKPAQQILRQQYNTPQGKPVYGNEALNFLMLGPRGFGKMTLPNEPIRIKDGWTTMEDVKVGDKVYGLNGELSTVKAKTQLQENLNMYKITFRDGRTATVCEDHQWYVWSKKAADKRNKNYSGPYITISTKEIAKKYYYSRTDSKHKKKYGTIKKCKEFMYAIPVIESLKEETSKNLPLHPYIVGALIGDGSLTKSTIQFTCTDPQLISRFNELLPQGYYLSQKKNLKDYSILRKDKSIPAFKHLCVQAGIHGNSALHKSIPAHYLYSSDSQRMELLKGLMDTDGYASTNSIEYCTISPQLNTDVQDLVRSLGFNCNYTRSEGAYRCQKTRKKIICNDRYRISIFPNREIFHLDRKKVYKFKSSMAEKTFITKIEKVKNASGYCIEVDNRTHTYIINDYIPTHNSVMTGNLAAHEYLFDGASDYDEFLHQREINNPMKSNTILGAGDAKYSNGTASKTKLTLDNLPGSTKIYTRVYPAPFSKKYKGSFSAGKGIVNYFDKKVGGTWEVAGSGSSIKNRTFKDNPFAAQGERAGVAIMDEIGMFSNLRESYAAMVDVMKSGSYKYGSIFFTGTGGDFEGTGSLDAQYMFYKPHEFDILSFEDVWEGRSPESGIGYFVPAYIGNNEMKDEWGYTLTDLAIKYEKAERKRLSSTQGDSLTLDNHIVYHPMVPSEVFLSKKGSYFPTSMIQARISTIQSSQLMEKFQVPMFLYFDEQSPYGIGYKLDEHKKSSPINEFPYNKDNKEGAIVIYEMPIYDGPTIPPDLYIIGHDPIRTDGSKGSLSSIYVLKTKKYATTHDHDQIVAEYVGRPSKGRKVINEILLKLSMFYGNATIYFENNVGNTKEYFEKMKKLHLLAKRPATVLSKKASYVGKPSDEYGYPLSTRAVKREAIQYLVDWVKEVKSVKDGKEHRVLDDIYSVALLKEMLQFDMEKGNFDRIMGLAGAIIGMQESHNQYEQIAQESLKHNEMEFLFDNPIFGYNPDYEPKNDMEVLNILASQY